MVKVFNEKMIKSAFGKDPLDKYSSPVVIKKTKLSQIFTMQPRDVPDKPSRSLAVVWDARVPLIEGYENKYMYTNTFFSKGVTAGNHYHNVKKELFIIIEGDFIVTLEDIVTKENEKIRMNAKDHSILYVPTRVAHAITSNSKNAILLVLASSPAQRDDEISYKLV